MHVVNYKTDICTDQLNTTLLFSEMFGNERFPSCNDRIRELFETIFVLLL